mmetsp:Transcript_13221/g.40740  ORF Transcript_13221/g.40740 Transcript_13221/m.40740 type:complete len:192 (+) Transcript_13221:1730-2305(+)
MPRKLDWRVTLGSVTLELQFSTGRESFVLSPLHATLILHFEDSESQTLGELSAKLHLSESTIKKKMMLWVNSGVIAEDPPGLYRVSSDLDASFSSLAFILDDEDQDPGSKPPRHCDTHAICSKYAIAILATCQGLSFWRIHKILELLLVQCSSSDYSPSAKELSTVLEQLCYQKVIKYADGQYTILTDQMS